MLRPKRVSRTFLQYYALHDHFVPLVYEDENALIPKNTSLLIARIPVLVQKTKPWEGYGGDNTPPPKIDEVGPIAKAVDLSSLDAPEDDKIKAMMSQSTQDYDPSKYVERF